MKTWVDSMYDTPEGVAGMAAAGLRSNARRSIDAALKSAGKSASEVADDLGWGKRRAGRVFESTGGKITMNELSDVLSACGFEVRLDVSALGTERARRVARRQEELCDQ